jgi:hypothetical protein
MFYFNIFFEIQHFKELKTVYHSIINFNNNLKSKRLNYKFSNLGTNSRPKFILNDTKVLK